ncbi:hypothetical protein CHS0354_020762 [Potamilus streckersoni]|uniref:Uncharacterized protein n=1 Tax=Potamilus streckersoni TaxID=2493646 RepID=A0AAE0SDD5_9BIVA|nr:hypothetical protein CHS0354_020762 [Potamilus streckersoni]
MCCLPLVAGIREYETAIIRHIQLGLQRVLFMDWYTNANQLDRLVHTLIINGLSHSTDDFMVTCLPSGEHLRLETWLFRGQQPLEVDSKGYSDRLVTELKSQEKQSSYAKT